MSTFEERETAFEAKFAHDEEMKFKAEAHANKLLGLWAAGLMGKSGDAAKAYALDVVKADFETPGHANVIAMIVADLDGKASEAEVVAKRAVLVSESKAALAPKD